MMVRSGVFLAMLGALACTTQDKQSANGFSRTWLAAPVDSVTIDLPLGAPAPDAEELVVLSLDSILGFRLTAAPYRVRIVDDGFVVLRLNHGRLMRFDSLGNLLADIPMAGVTDPRSAAVCLRGDSVLVVDGAGLYNQPRRLVWFAFGNEIGGAEPDTVTVALPTGTLEVRCTSIGDRWVLVTTIPEEPDDMTSRLTTQLIEVAPGTSAAVSPIFTLIDRSEQMRDSSGRAMMQPSPWAVPPLIAADSSGRLYVVDGPSGVVRIIDTAASGAMVRGITPRPMPLTREVIDSVAAAWREREVAVAARHGPLSPYDVAMLDRTERAIHGITPGVPVPEVERLLVGVDGSFALLASQWVVPGVDRWDLFAPGGGYIGAVKISALSRGVGVQRGTLWYVKTTNDSTGGAPELVRARPRSATPSPHLDRSTVRAPMR